jgi:hypothetical protein
MANISNTGKIPYKARENNFPSIFLRKIHITKIRVYFANGETN